MIHSISSFAVTPRSVIIIIIALLFAVPDLSDAQEVIRFENADDVIKVGKQLHIHYDESKNLTIKDMLTMSWDGFERTDKEVYTNIPTGAAVWYAFQLESSVGEDVWMHVNTIHYRTLDLYKVNEDGRVVDSVITGQSRPESQKAYDAATYYLPLLKRKDSGVHTYYVRTTTYMPVEFPTKVGTLVSLLEIDQTGDILAAGFLGLMIIMILYNGFLYFSLRDILYVIYSLHLIFSMFTISYVNNHPLIQGDAFNYWAHDLFHLWSSLNYLVVVVFASQYLKWKTEMPKFYTATKYYMLVFLAVSIASVWIPVEIDLFHQLMSIILQLGLVATAYYMFFKMKKPILAFTLGWTCTVTAILVTMASYEGVLPYNQIFRNALFFGVSLEILLFSLALGARVNILRKSEQALNKGLRNTNRELQRLNESLDTFNYHVSHDLKTVLGNTQSLGLMLRKYNDKGDKVKMDDIIDRLMQTSKEGVKTIQSFLEFSQINTNAGSAKLEELNVVDEVNSVMTIHELGEKVKVHFGKKEFETIQMNPNTIDSLILNLLTNAIKYNEQFPEVRIDLEYEEKCKLVKFTDNGVGIDLETNEEKLFKPFSRLMNKEQAEGNGIGLHLVYRIVTSVRGKVRVESEVGKGSTFILKFRK